MNWRRGLFRLWIVGTALFVLAIAFVSYSEIKAEFDAVARKQEAASMLATNAKFANWVHQRFYSDMPTEQFDKKIIGPKPITEPNVIAQLEAIVANLDTSRPFDEWTVDELQAYVLHRFIEPTPNPWATLVQWASIAFGTGGAGSRGIPGVGLLRVCCKTVMNELPYWVQYVQALGPTVVAVIAALFALYIGLRQWRTAHYRHADLARWSVFARTIDVSSANESIT
jgi:hypothetical protein